jgi:two-component system chemotaxis response regulator CheB
MDLGMIKLLIVDDSALMRRQLSSVFEEQGDFEIRLARNGKEAVEENLNFKPDVVTLDINMPVMDGLTALSTMMAQRKVPVVMVSSLTEQGALATFEAIALGAVDYIAKPDGTISSSLDSVKKELVGKVRAAVGAHIKDKRAISTPVRLVEKAKPHTPSNSIVIIGVSTGGPRTLEEILPGFPADFPHPIVVAQHMPASFTGAFAARMNKLCQLQVVEATHPMQLEAGIIYIGKGCADIMVSQREGISRVMPKPENSEFAWHPSVELLGRSVLEYYDPTKVIAVMLTGMGYDGADAFTEIKKRGGRTIAESKESCVVFGMPAELISRNGATVVLPATRITRQILAWTNN